MPTLDMYIFSSCFMIICCAGVIAQTDALCLLPTCTTRSALKLNRNDHHIYCPMVVQWCGLLPAQLLKKCCSVLPNPTNSTLIDRKQTDGLPLRCSTDSAAMRVSRAGRAVFTLLASRLTPQLSGLGIHIILHSLASIARWSFAFSHLCPPFKGRIHAFHLLCIDIRLPWESQSATGGSIPNTHCLSPLRYLHLRP